VAWAVRLRSVSSPRSLSRTCELPASGSPIGFTERLTVYGQWRLMPRDDTMTRDQPSPWRRAPSEAFRSRLVFVGSSPITDPRLLRKRARSKGLFLRRHCPASTVLWPCPTPARFAVLATALEVRPPTVTGLGIWSCLCASSEDHDFKRRTERKSRLCTGSWPWQAVRFHPFSS
jgi:hypothetical protein